MLNAPDPLGDADDLDDLDLLVARALGEVGALDFLGALDLDEDAP